MIVVSGGLVVVAIVLLAVGLITGNIEPVYFSIGVSVVAGVFLLLGALQRRGEMPTSAPAGEGGTPAPDALQGAGAVSLRSSEEPAAPEEFDEEDEGLLSAGEVSVVPGRPRYHVSTCRFLAGRSDVEVMAVEDAQEDGYTACGVCKPDQAIAAAQAAEAEAEEPAEPEVDEVEEPAEAEEPEPVLALVPDIEEEPAPAKPARRTASSRTATKAAAEKTAAAAKPAKPAKAATASRAATVVVIPDRDKFHRETCRFVRDVPGTLTVTKATAKRQGYNPCGVCKP